MLKLLKFHFFSIIIADLIVIITAIASMDYIIISAALCFTNSILFFYQFIPAFAMIRNPIYRNKLFYIYFTLAIIILLIPLIYLGSNINISEPIFTQLCFLRLIVALLLGNFFVIQLYLTFKKNISI